MNNKYTASIIYFFIFSTLFFSVEYFGNDTKVDIELLLKSVFTGFVAAVVFGFLIKKYRKKK